MKNKLAKTIELAIIIGLCLGVASAIYSGESETFDFGFEIVNCSIINNSFDLEGLGLSWNNTNVTISTAINYKPDNFSISCWVIKYKEVIEKSVPSGSSRGGGICFRGYTVSNWSGCVEGNQAREVKKDWKQCYLKRQEKPIDIQSCEIIVDDGDADDEIPDEKDSDIFWRISLVILFLLIIVIIKIILYIIKKKKWKNWKYLTRKV